VILLSAMSLSCDTKRAESTYWDNNGGSNYVSENHSGLQFTAAEGNIQLYTAYGYSYNNSVGMSANLRNLNPNKTVKVVYSWDNWNTVNEAYFSYAAHDLLELRQRDLQPQQPRN
jgi:hypothetical protein